ncbi:MAG: HEPN domain-containing protein [Bacteroidales bacterium]|nr:HEPN domain-containing protein [Bacteroidales bacterium]
MNEKIENTDKIVQHWIDSSEQNYSTMQNLMGSKDYSWALFVGHLVIEKLLKAIYVKNLQCHAIFTHDLLRLANKIDLNITDEQQEWLDKITTFNLNARYDNYKQNFYKLCTKEFTDEWIIKIEKLKQWLINQL